MVFTPVDGRQSALGPTNQKKRHRFLPRHNSVPFSVKQSKPPNSLLNWCRHSVWLTDYLMIVEQRRSSRSLVLSASRDAWLFPKILQSLATSLQSNPVSQRSAHCIYLQTNASPPPHANKRFTTRIDHDLSIYLSAADLLDPPLPICS